MVPAIRGGVAMSGRWLKRDVDVHRCARPNDGTTVRAGDQWLCDDCGAVWTVNRIEHGMQWDPIDPPAITWEVGR